MNSLLKKILLPLGLLTLAVVFTGCGSDSDNLAAPVLTMDLPASMTSATPAPLNAMTALTVPGEGTRAANHQNTDCNFGQENDPFKDGYTTTKFLVNVSQTMSCFADTLITAVMTNGQSWIGAGLISTGNAAPDTTHVQIELNATTYQTWLFSDDAGVDPNVYITWDSVTGNGQMIFLGTPTNPGDLDALRVDFNRSADLDVNDAFFHYSAGSFLEGFHIEVSRQGSGNSANYQARGLLSLLNQWDPTLATRSGQTFPTPSLAVISTTNSSGQGAAKADFQDVGLHIETPALPAIEWFNFGSYLFTTSDKTYFTQNGAEEWRNKSVTTATYVNTNANTRGDGNGGAILTWLSGCLEGDNANSLAICGTKADGTTPNVPGMNLGANYFTTGTCDSTHGGDCSAFMQGFYDLGWDNPVVNSTTAEPSDFRATDLAATTNLTNVWPAGETATSTFVIPVAP